MGELGIYVAAFVMGLAGSLHCLGMCGPIFIASASFYESPKQYAIPLLLHHIGKLGSYAAIGVVMGLIGKGASLLWLQNKVMVVCGILLLIMATASLVRLKTISSIHSWITASMGKVLKKSKATAVLLGLVNGLIPCGLVYAAGIGAAAAQSVSGGIVFMLAFGMGTIPALSMVGFSRWLIPIKRIKNLRVWKQIPMLILGTWLLLKGLGLGIPIISPDLGSHNPNKNCCEKHNPKH